MTLYDISMPLASPMQTYPGVTPYRRTLRRSLAQGDSSNLSDMEMCAHTGTHVDAPFHFIARGASIEQIPLAHCCGPAQVVDCRGCTAITAERLQGRIPAKTARVLLKTDNSERLRESPSGPFRPDAVYLAGDGAEYLAGHGVQLVGIDALAIDKPGQPRKPSHALLLAGNITILEGLALADVEPGEYFLFCAPLKMVGSDGAPCRAVLMDMAGFART